SHGGHEPLRQPVLPQRSLANWAIFHRLHFGVGFGGNFLADRSRYFRVDGSTGGSALSCADFYFIASRRALRVASRTRDGGLGRSEEHTSELQSRFDLVCRLLLEKK